MAAAIAIMTMTTIISIIVNALKKVARGVLIIPLMPCGWHSIPILPAECLILLDLILLLFSIFLLFILLRFGYYDLDLPAI